MKYLVACQERWLSGVGKEIESKYKELTNIWKERERERERDILRGKERDEVSQREREAKMIFALFCLNLEEEIDAAEAQSF